MAPAAPVMLDARTVETRTDVWVKAYVDAGDFSGVVLIAQSDKILVHKAYGKADPQLGSPNRLETRFRVASLSKTFTAAAVEALIAEGKLKLTDTLNRYVSGIPNGDAITIEQLLLHESGVGVLEGADVERDCLPKDELLNRLRAAKPFFAPGKNSQYSNEGYFLLSLVVEKVSGSSFEEFLKKSIYSQLQMSNSGIACKDLPSGRNAFGSVAAASENGPIPLPFNEAALQGAGSVYSSAADLYQWLKAVDGNPQLQTSKWKYPYGWGKRNYSGKNLIEQSGQLEGFNAHIALYLKEHIYAVILSNVQSGFTNRAPKDLEAVLFGGVVSKPPVIQALTLGERSMKQYEGTYRSKETPYTQTLAFHEGQLAMHWSDFPFWRQMTMIQGDTFFVRSEYAEVHFERNRDGYVSRMVWNWAGGAHLAFEKIDISPPPPPAQTTE